MATIIPAAIEDLYTYLVKVVAYIIANKTRLGVSTTNVTNLTTKYGDETTAGTYLCCKKQYDLQPKRKDTVVTTNLSTVSDEIKGILTIIYNDIPASALTDTDRLTLNIKKGEPHTITHHNTPISDKCVIEMERHANGLFIGAARTDTDTKNHNIPTGADMIEIRYAVVEGKFKAGAELASKVKSACLGPDDGTQSLMFRKAHFRFSLPVELAGFDAHIWGRWINSAHPELAGEFSERHILMIMA